MFGTYVTRIDRAELTLRQKPWPFAIERRAEIEAHFADLRRQKPALWNGRILLMHEHAIEDGVLRGAYLETDFASFVAWKAWRPKDAGVIDCTAATALIGADGGLILGEMNTHTANAGQIYFPCGTPDQNDIAGTRVDLEGSAWRELEEETGLAAREFAAESGWVLVFAGWLLLAVKVLRAKESAQRLRERILGHLARDPQPELRDIRIVHGPADVDPAMPGFVTAFLGYWWREGHTTQKP
jgi:8-oxo-dGTP pyrophosphatase MutT (NUDIX family)